MPSPKGTVTPSPFVGTTIGGGTGRLSFHLNGALTGDITGAPATCGNITPSPPPQVAGVRVPSTTMFTVRFMFRLGGSPGSFITSAAPFKSDGSYSFDFGGTDFDQSIVRYGDLSNPYLTDSDSYNQTVTGPHGHRTWKAQSGAIKISGGGRSGSIDASFAPIETGAGFQFKVLGPDDLKVRGTFTC